MESCDAVLAQSSPHLADLIVVLLNRCHVKFWHNCYTLHVSDLKDCRIFQLHIPYPAGTIFLDYTEAVASFPLLRWDMPNNTDNVADILSIATFFLKEESELQNAILIPVEPLQIRRTEIKIVFCNLDFLE